MYSKTVTNDKRGRKKTPKCVSKSRTSIAELESVKLSNKRRNKSKTKHGEYRTTSSSEKSKTSHGKMNSNKLDMYKTMKKMLEKKYKQMTSKNNSDEKLFPERKQYDSKVYSVMPEINKLPFSENTPEKTSSVSDVVLENIEQNKTQVESKEQLPNQKLITKSGTKVRRLESSKTSKHKKPDVTKQRIKTSFVEASVPKRKLDSRFPTMKPSELLKDIKPKKNTNPSKIPEKQAKYKISKRLENLAHYREIPCQVKRDLKYNPFAVKRRALLFQDKPCKLKPGSNENRSKSLKKGHERKLIKISEPKKQNFGHYRKRRRLIKTSKCPYTTARILELAKPMVKHPPMNILTPEEVFTVKKRALKAKCSKRISELAYPVLRPEDLKIKTDSYPFSIKRRALRARCTRRVRELAKPLARRCRSAVKKQGEERAEG